MLNVLRKIITEKKEEYYFLCLLKKLQTENIEHKEGSFFEHLFGTYRLLKKWKCGKPLCVAGLFHSIYGTQVFKRKTIPYSQRSTLKNIIGEEAETLVYFFSVLDRPRIFTEKIKSKSFINKETNENIICDKKTIRNLIILELANLIDQKADKKLIEKILFVNPPKEKNIFKYSSQYTQN